MKKTIFLTTVFTFLILFANAQDEQHKARWEKYRSEKISYLTDKMEISPAEAKKL